MDKVPTQLEFFLGFHPIGVKCYRFVNLNATHSGALLSCRHLGAKLAEPTTPQEADTISREFGERGMFWIGVDDLKHEDR